MPYATIPDVERAAGGRRKLEQLSDLDNKGKVDDAVVTAVIAEADSLLNSYFQHRYAVPIPDDDVPEIVRRMAARVAVYMLKEDREALTGEDQTRHEANVTWLQGVRSGSISLGVDPRLNESTSVVPVVGVREEDDFRLTRRTFRDAGFT